MGTASSSASGSKSLTCGQVAPPSNDSAMDNGLRNSPSRLLKTNAMAPDNNAHACNPLLLLGSLERAALDHVLPPSVDVAVYTFWCALSR